MYPIVGRWTKNVMLFHWMMMMSCSRNGVASLNAKTYYIVCDEHFSEDAKFVAYHNQSNLKKTAVPSLFLPDSLEVEPGCSKRSASPLYSEEPKIVKGDTLQFEEETDETCLTAIIQPGGDMPTQDSAPCGSRCKTPVDKLKSGDEYWQKHQEPNEINTINELWKKIAVEVNSLDLGPSKTGKTKPNEINTINELWKKIAVEVNSLDLGPSKTADQWKKLICGFGWA
ncbi:hypothetical protein QE152_g8475 [Popillia japonica]|uniref:THAP-type domain-containing protein n=1 Tax=Popillia japonica TaxID=7064 RepID=A0AAW1MAL8_POPJA